jgi:hypothetical protein
MVNKVKTITNTKVATVNMADVPMVGFMTGDPTDT